MTKTEQRPAGDPAPPAEPIMRRIVPASRDQRTIAASTLVNSTGTGLYTVTSVLYFTRFVGMSVSQVSVGVTLGALIGLGAAVPVGYVADRMGARRAYVAGLGVAAAAMAGFALIHSFWLFLVASCLAGVASSASQTAQPSLVRAYGGPDIVTFRAYLRSVINLGYGGGALVATVAIQEDSQRLYIAILLLNGVSYLACAAMIMSLPERVIEAPKSAARSWIALRDRPFATVSLMSGAMALHSALLTFALPLWIIDHSRVPHWLASGALALNTLFVIVFQVRVSRGVGDVVRAGRALRVSGALVLCGMAVLAALPRLGPWPGTVAVVAGVTAYSLGELWQTAGSMELNYGLAVPHAQGQYSGVFSLGQGAAFAGSPAVLALVCLHAGAVGWLAMGAAIALLGAVMPPVAAWAQGTRPAYAE